MLVNREQKVLPFYHCPVVVLALGSLSSLSLTLETLLSQSGIRPQNVRVVYSPQQIRDVPQLCSLFGFTPQRTKAQDYWEMLRVGLEVIKEEYQKAPYVTVIEEGVLLSPDYFPYVAEMAQLLEDPSVLGVSAWNPNGFREVSSRVDLAYRVESISWLAFTIKISNYVRYLKPHLQQCCNKRGWEGWSIPSSKGKEIIIPDVSRCFYIPNFEAVQNTSASSLLTSLFYRERTTNLDPRVKVKRLSSLHLSKYDTLLESVLTSNNSQKIEITKDQVLSFYEGGTLTLLFSYLNNENSGKSSMFVLPFIEAKPNTLEGTKMLCRCFGLFYHENYKPLGLYKGTLRFSVNQVEFMLLSSLSPFFKLNSYNLTTLVLP